MKRCQFVNESSWVLGARIPSSICGRAESGAERDFNYEIEMGTHTKNNDEALATDGYICYVLRVLNIPDVLITRCCVSFLKSTSK